MYYNTEKELYDLLKSTNHDLRILGSDYEDKQYTGIDLGVTTYFCQRNHDYSTTLLKKKVHDSMCESRNLEKKFEGDKKIYVFDIDGTLVTNTNGKYEFAKPLFEPIKRLNQLYEQGHKIILMTARGASSGIDHTEITKKQMKEFGVKFHELIMHQKPTADFFIDDKAINVKDWL